MGQKGGPKRTILGHKKFIVFFLLLICECVALWAEVVVKSPAVFLALCQGPVGTFFSCFPGCFQGPAFGTSVAGRGCKIGPATLRGTWCSVEVSERVPLSRFQGCSQSPSQIPHQGYRSISEPPRLPIAFPLKRNRPKPGSARTIPPAHRCVPNHQLNFPLLNGCSCFVYNWQLPAYSGVVLVYS